MHSATCARPPPIDADVKPASAKQSGDWFFEDAPRAAAPMRPEIAGRCVERLSRGAP